MKKRDYEREIAKLETSNGLMIDYIRWALLLLMLVLSLKYNNDWLGIGFVVIAIIHYVNIGFSSKSCHNYLDGFYKESDRYESYIEPLNWIIDISLLLFYLIIIYKY